MKTFANIPVRIKATGETGTTTGIEWMNEVRGGIRHDWIEVGVQISGAANITPFRLADVEVIKERGVEYAVVLPGCSQAG